jgi:hypothetical protein
MLASDSERSGEEQVYQKPVSQEAWTVISAVTDLSPDLSRLELSLVLRGNGSAWFDDVKVEVLGPAVPPSPVALSSWQLENVAILARAAALVRYRHPSDQSAKLDWDAFLPAAVDRVLGVKGRTALLKELRELFNPIAPTVEISELPSYSLVEPPHGTSAYLTRWRRIGFGSDSRYVSWREGIDADLAKVNVEVLVELPELARCKTASLKAAGYQFGEHGEAIVYADIGQPGEASKVVDLKLKLTESAVSTVIDMPVDAYNIRLGVKVNGRAGFVLRALALTCDGRDSVDIDLAHAGWLHRGNENLYTYRTSECGSGKCLTVQPRPFDTSFVAGRDVLDAEIADHLWIHVPLAVWSDGARTFPAVDGWTSSLTYGPTDLPTRLAIIASAWGTLSLFYPYFSDQHINWSRELLPGLASIARTGSLADIYQALSVFLAGLHDNHVRVYHSHFQIDGVLPIALRRFGNTLIVVGSLERRIRVGAEVLSIDGIAALHAYDEMDKRISSATTGWSDMFVPFWLTVGSVGTFSTVRVKASDGKINEYLLPHLPRRIYDSLVREPRPAFGSELASGVYYVDLEALKHEAWLSAIPLLVKARAIVMDMRGYPSNVVFGILGHFSERPLLSPEMKYPLLESGEYLRSFWEIRPVKPKLSAKVIVLLDGRASSAAETVLQIVHDSHLATLVGEASAGTNGNANVAPLPGGFSMRFTGMRVVLEDGTALQGKGIVPDVIVHPTLEGVRAGRDEVLEAALSLASRL